MTTITGRLVVKRAFVILNLPTVLRHGNSRCTRPFRQFSGTLFIPANLCGRCLSNAGSFVGTGKRDAGSFSDPPACGIANETLAVIAPPRWSS